MSEMWLEDLDTEGAEYSSDLYDDAEDDDQDELEWEDEGFGEEGEDEESRASRQRRSRARRIALARRRQAVTRARAQRRGRGPRRPTRVPPSRVPAPRATPTTAAIRAVDLNAKVAEDGLRRQLTAQRKRMSRSEYAAVAGLAVNQFVESFNQPENSYARAALRFAPLLLLSPQKRGSGIEGFAYDPRVIGGAAVLGITFLGEQRGKASIEVAATSEVRTDSSVQFVAQVLSTRGEVLSGRTVRWESSDPTVAEVSPTGVVTGKKAGAVFIIVSAEGLPARRIPLVVTQGGHVQEG